MYSVYCFVSVWWSHYESFIHWTFSAKMKFHVSSSQKFHLNWVVVWHFRHIAPNLILTPNINRLCVCVCVFTNNILWAHFKISRVVALFHKIAQQFRSVNFVFLCFSLRLSHLILNLYGRCATQTCCTFVEFFFFFLVQPFYIYSPTTFKQAFNMKALYWITNNPPYNWLLWFEMVSLTSMGEFIE